MNQCPHHTLTNQWAEHITSFFLSRTIFSSPFWKSASRTDSTRPAKKKDLSLVACHRNPALTIFTEDNCYHRYPLKKIMAATSYTHKRTNAATCNTLKNWCTTCNTATWYLKRTFSRSDTNLLSVIKINHSLLFFKEVLLFCLALHK